MNKLISFALVLAMVFSMAACGCTHEATQSKLITVDTASLTAQWEVSCTQCGEVIEATESATGIAPAEGMMVMSPQEWFTCLTTVIRTYETSGMLIPIEAESQDDALLYSVLTLSGFKSAISFYDAEGNVLTTTQAAERGKVHEIRIEAQFDNSTAESFLTLLMLIGINNNSSWTNDSVNQLGRQIMGGETVSDNGYTYTMEIISVENHTVCVSITAEQSDNPA